jgi:hypothetical protein
MVQGVSEQEVVNFKSEGHHQKARSKEESTRASCEGTTGQSETAGADTHFEGAMITITQGQPDGTNHTCSSLLKEVVFCMHVSATVGCTKAHICHECIWEWGPRP